MGACASVNEAKQDAVIQGDPQQNNNGEQKQFLSSNPFANQSEPQGNNVHTTQQQQTQFQAEPPGQHYEQQQVYSQPPGGNFVQEQTYNPQNVNVQGNNSTQSHSEAKVGIVQHEHKGGFGVKKEHKGGFGVKKEQNAGLGVQQEQKAEFVVHQEQKVGVEVKQESAGFSVKTETKEAQLPITQEETKPDEDFVLGEIESGVTYWIGSVSKKLRSLNVSAGEAKNAIPHNEEKIKKDNSLLKHIRVGFEPSETANVDYFLSGIFSTSAYRDVQVTFEQISMFTQQGFVNFGLSLAKLQLNKFTIEAWGDDFNDNVLTCVKPGIVNQNALKSFDVYNYESDHVTDEGIKQISEAIQGINTLEECGLLFEKATKITSNSFASLKQALHSKPCLKTINFTFNKAKLDDNAIHFMKEVVQSLPRLENLILSFNGSGINPGTLGNFSSYAISLGLKECTIQPN